MKVPFLDFAAHVAGLRHELDQALARVLDSAHFVLGPEGEAFESELAQALGAVHAVAVGNGTDAIQLALRTLGVGPGDEVVTSPITAAFTALAIQQTGARPVFVDVEKETLNLDPALVPRALTPRTKAILPVHLYGHPTDMDPLLALGREKGVAIVEDACQAHGARYRGRPVGTLAGEQALAALSFYPTKNLGALGDGGAVLASDPAHTKHLRQLRNGGQTTRYWHESFGVNSRLDELQAAILRVGLRQLPAWIERRRALAAFYLKELADSGLGLPREQPYAHAVYHLFVVRHPRRDACAAALAELGVGTLVHYPIPLHRLPAFAEAAPPRLPVAEAACAEILSLPLYPELRDEQAQHVVEAVRAALHRVQC